MGVRTLSELLHDVVAVIFQDRMSGLVSGTGGLAFRGPVGRHDPWWPRVYWSLSATRLPPGRHLTRLA